MIKREILTCHEDLYMKLVRGISSCFAIKMLSKNTGFSHLKYQRKRKKIDTACFRRFSKFQPTRKWVNEVNVSSLQLKKILKSVLGCLVREKQNILTPLPCLHTLMQTRLSANQNARTILVIL